MKLRHLEVFYAVMKTGSVSAAARHLNVSQPSVSGLLRHAEESLGVQLFERRAGRLHPTTAAAELLPDVEEVFERVSLVGQTLKDIRSSKSRELIVASSPTLANTLLSQAVARFRQMRAQTSVFIHSVSTYLVMDRMEKREADIGLVYGSHDGAAARIEHLVTSPIICAVPVGHALADRAWITTADLAAEAIISLGPTTAVGRAVLKACHEAGVQAPTVQVEANSSFAGCLMAADGAGVALIDQTSFLSERFPDLVFRPFAPAASVDLSLVFPLNRRATPAAETLALILRTLAAASALPAPDAGLAV